MQVWVDTKDPEARFVLLGVNTLFVVVFVDCLCSKTLGTALSLVLNIVFVQKVQRLNDDGAINLHHSEHGSHY